jgi:hypothetical protein
MARAKRPSLWVVTRFAPATSQWSDGPAFYLHTSSEDTRSGAPVAAFVEQEDAEAEAERLHALAVRETPIGPFLSGLVWDSRERFAEAARAAGVPEPDFSSLGPVVKPHVDSFGIETTGPRQMEYTQKVQRAVRAWWEGVAETISPDALAKLWEVLFPDFSFYRMGRVLLEA